MKIRILLLFALFLICTLQSTAGQDIASSALTPQQKLDAVNVVRLINTCEFKYKARNGRFGMLEDLISSGMLAQMKGTFPSVAEKLDYGMPSRLLSGFVLQLTMSTDGSSYQLSLIDDTKQKRWGLFSDDKGLIFSGSPI
jgi:hypothetical protein